MLQAATLGVSRVHFHNGLGYRYNIFQPTQNIQDGLNITRSHILPLYHAFLVVNEAIGNCTTPTIEGDTRECVAGHVAELGTLDGTLAAYGIWEEGKLVRMVMIHSGLYQDGQRGQLHVQLQGFSDRVKKIKVKRLAVPKTEAYTGL